MASAPAWLRRLLHRETVERELDEEFQFHVDMHAERNRRLGMATAEARRAALVAFGGRERFKEAVRDERGGRWLEDLARDLRFAARALRRAPGFTAVAVLSLALGIGANTAVFSVVSAVLLRPLPYPTPERLVRVGITNDGQGSAGGLSTADAVALAASPAFSTFGVYSTAMGGLTLTGAGAPERLDATLVTSGVFRTLGVRPLLGRAIQPMDDAPGAPRVVVLSHGTWQERFGGSPDVIGRALTLDGEPHTVIGVMPPGFRVPRVPREELWPVLQLEAPEYRAPFWLLGVGRMAADQGVEGLRATLAATAAAVKRQYPDSPPQWRYDVEDLRTWLVRDVRTTLLAVYGAVALILLMSATNVANLLLARASTRGTELAVRTALGAGRRRLVRQLLTESVLLAASGAVLGLLLAVGGVRAFVAFLPGDLPRADEVAVDGVVLLFTAVVALLVGVLVGLLPALQVPQRQLAGRLREGGRAGTAGVASRRIREALVVAEFALALVVVVGAALLVGTLHRLQQVDAGVVRDGVLVAHVALPRASFAEPAQVERFFDRLLERVRALPGVTAASVSMAVPPDQLVMRNPYTPEGTTFAPDERAPVAEELIVSAEYFQALGIPILHGRAFAETDREGTPEVVIVNETLARRHFPGQDPVGRWLQTGDPDPDAPKLTIVGVVPDVKYAGLASEPQPTIYVPYRQNLWWRAMYLVVRTGGEPLALAAPVRAAIAEVDARVPLERVRTMDRLLFDSVAAPRFRAGLLAGFGLVALVLAAAGIYGVLSYTVSQRRRETAVRMALGAQPRDVVRQVVRDGLRLALAGVAVGLVLALGATRLLDELLFGVSRLDPLTYAGAALFLATLGVAACVLPARRATRTDPNAALRAE